LGAQETRMKFVEAVEQAATESAALAGTLRVTAAG
jgi:hypothetical protein